QKGKNAGWFGPQRAMTVAVRREPGTNTVEVARRVKDAMGELERGLPPSVAVHMMYDRSVSIERSVSDVRFSLMLALGLVVLVIFLFLRKVVATIIPSLTLPMAVVGTFPLLAFLALR